MFYVFREDKAKASRLKQFIEQNLVVPDTVRYA
ncbi:hypothetical protein FHR25_005079, partial [Yokenella regensburgei]